MNLLCLRWWGIALILIFVVGGSAHAQESMLVGRIFAPKPGITANSIVVFVDDMAVKKHSILRFKECMASVVVSAPAKGRTCERQANLFPRTECNAVNVAFSWGNRWKIVWVELPPFKNSHSQGTSQYLGRRVSYVGDDVLHNNQLAHILLTGGVSQDDLRPMGSNEFFSSECNGISCQPCLTPTNYIAKATVNAAMTRVETAVRLVGSRSQQKVGLFITFLSC